MSLQEDKFDVSYWDDLVNDGNQFVSAKGMIYYIAMVGIFVQSVALMITPSNWLIWNALGFIVATNLGAVFLAIKAQFSAEDIAKKTSQAFNADFYHTLHLMTEAKKAFQRRAEEEGHSLEAEIDSLGGDLYDVVTGYVTTYSQHMKTEVEMAESKKVAYESEEDLFE